VIKMYLCTWSGNKKVLHIPEHQVQMDRTVPRSGLLAQKNVFSVLKE